MSEESFFVRIILQITENGNREGYIYIYGDCIKFCVSSGKIFFKTRHDFLIKRKYYLCEAIIKSIKKQTTRKQSFLEEIKCNCNTVMVNP
jgi:hypothetical protein